MLPSCQSHAVHLSNLYVELAASKISSHLNYVLIVLEVKQL